MRIEDWDEEPDWDDRPSGPFICTSCGNVCNPVRLDVGIGRYEYWGATGTHHQWVWVSPCCEDDFVEGDCVEVSRSTQVSRRDRGVRWATNESGAPIRVPAIRAGDRYERRVFKHWRKGGPSWYTVEYAAR